MISSPIGSDTSGMTRRWRAWPKNPMKRAEVSIFTSHPTLDLGSHATQPGGSRAFTIALTPDMCAKIAACSERQLRQRPHLHLARPTHRRLGRHRPPGTDSIETSE